MDNVIGVNNGYYEVIDILPYSPHDILVYVSENDGKSFHVDDDVIVSGNYEFRGTVTEVLTITGMDKSMVKASGRFFACQR